MTEYQGPDTPSFIGRDTDRKSMVLAALLRNDGILTKAAFELGICTGSLTNIIQKEGLETVLHTIRQDAKIRILEEKRFRRYQPASIRGL